MKKNISYRKKNFYCLTEFYFDKITPENRALLTTILIISSVLLLGPILFFILLFDLFFYIAYDIAKARNLNDALGRVGGAFIVLFLYFTFGLTGLLGFSSLFYLVVFDIEFVGDILMFIVDNAELIVKWILMFFNEILDSIFDWIL